MVEQGTHKPLVGGSNPPSATRLDRPTTRRPAGRVVAIPSVDGRATIRTVSASVRRCRDQDLRHGVVAAPGAILGRNRRRIGAVRTPEAPSLNPKFFRNGIVMLVLVLGTAALLFTWINASQPAAPGRLLGSSSTTSRPARSRRSSRKARS